MLSGKVATAPLTTAQIFPDPAMPHRHQDRALGRHGVWALWLWESWEAGTGRQGLRVRTWGSGSGEGMLSHHAVVRTGGRWYEARA
jgi:hypothetical protein